MSTSCGQDKLDVSDGEVVINPTTYSRSNARNFAVVMDLIEHLIPANAIHVLSCCILPIYPDQKKAYVDAIFRANSTLLGPQNATPMQFTGRQKTPPGRETGVGGDQNQADLSVTELGLVFGDFQATAGPNTDVRDVGLLFLPRLNVLGVGVLKKFWTVELEKYLVNGGAAD
ncbi:hypothetical protein Asppvi_007861 [Aspergillus pseudoviridinutans]|uniref:Uncharacterized protein n=1 Tax=Aspergillus pseudoviridinutans TaxID=1517512 RepID=A0A9P3BH63_9EURO|nr:uncharacterized protein Asppvi_007861 [Aspergillus pseudoviridinutans]GIJ88933.1 hypothetical protein Asppvi_007861 [Aspergillus pseudoviridinutans]